MTATEYATPENFQTWEKQAKTMSESELLFVINDCRRAEEAMRGWNSVKEGFYSDQASTYGMELQRRRG